MQILLKTTKILAIAQILLGTIHCAMTPVIMPNIPPEVSNPFLCMFLMAGILCIYIGVVMLKEVKQLKHDESGKMGMINISLIIILFSGILAVLTLSGNPFAWISFVIGISGASIIFTKQLLAK